jgi:hypothetical protein
MVVPRTNECGTGPTLWFDALTRERSQSFTSRAIGWNSAQNHRGARTGFAHHNPGLKSSIPEKRLHQKVPGSDFLSENPRILRDGIAYAQFSMREVIVMKKKIIAVLQAALMFAMLTAAAGCFVDPPYYGGGWHHHDHYGWRR